MSRSPSVSLKSELGCKPDPKSLRRWVVAFCIVRFDLEQGQLLEECFPPHSLTPDEELEVSFNSFPDSVSQHHNRASIHDCIFFFRFQRHHNPIREGDIMSEVTETDVTSKSKESMEGGTVRRPENGGNAKVVEYLYGYVFNRQRHDERLKRGGEQKSVVILSHTPYSSVFRPLLQIMGPLYFDIGRKAIEHIASYVSMWPAPVPGRLMELPIGNAKFKVNLPPAHSLPLENLDVYEESASPMAPCLPNNPSVPQGLFHDSDLFGIFKSHLLQLWMLWELLMIGEPILIIAPTPPQCCEAVTSLVSLVAPLHCTVDFRPYFTIHDPDFARLNSLRDSDTFPPMLLGVTNLFFLKALRNIPHVVSVGNPAPDSNRFALASKSMGKVPFKAEGRGFQQLSLKRFSPTNLLNTVKLRRDGPLCLMTEHKEAIWSTYSAATKPDTSVLNRLIDAGLSPRTEESMSVVNNEILRRHFLELTTNFLAPFGPYFRVTAPSDGFSPYMDPPPLPPFSIDEFVMNLTARGVGKFLSKRMKSNWIEFYRRFLNGPNFMPWFQRRRAAAVQEQHRLWRKARMVIDMPQLLSSMNELEVVDCFKAIEKYLHEEVKKVGGGGGGLETQASYLKQRTDLQAVYNALPRDTQQLLISNPQTAALLQVGGEHTKLPGHPTLQIGALPSSLPR